MNKLLNMLAYKRPAFSESEENFIKIYIDSLPNIQRDGFGNRYLYIGENPSTMFCAHTDTVHNSDGLQKLYIDDAAREVFADDSNCLGADDTTGVFIMIEMIKKKIPGLYVFFRAEEIGGKGSLFFAREHAELLAPIKHCLSLDRKGDSSVITHQFRGRTCSDVFARALCAQLGEKWKPDNTGSFTDSANLADIIPECTNISIGYARQHTDLESQCLVLPFELPEIFARVDWKNLPVSRDASLIDDGFDWWGVPARAKSWPKTSREDIGYWSTYDDVLTLVYDEPEYAADILFDFLNNQ